MPARLAIFLAGLCLFAILIVGNTDRIDVFLLIGIWEMSVGRLIMISTGLGAFMAWLLISHLGSYKKFRTKAKEAKAAKQIQANPKGKTKSGKGTSRGTSPAPPAMPLAAAARPPSEALAKKKRKKILGIF